MDKAREGGGGNVDKDFWVFRPFLGQFSLFNAYLVVFGQFLPKTEEKIKIPIINNF